MIEQLVTSWQSVVSAFFAAPLALAEGRVSHFSVIPTLGLVLLAAGLILAVIWREKQARWLLPPLVVTALSPVVLGFFDIILGWIGLLFAIFVGVILLLVWIGTIAADATRRLPIWLIGWSFTIFVVFTALVNIALTWGLA